jgi:hypothetical protein
MTDALREKVRAFIGAPNKEERQHTRPQGFLCYLSRSPWNFNVLQYRGTSDRSG